MLTESKDPLGDGISCVTLLDISGSDLTVANSARVSLNKHSDKITEKDKKLIKFLLNSRPPHTSPLEHNQLRYRIKLPIFVARELHRHRIGISTNEASGRYLEFGRDFPLDFYVPHIWRGQSTSNRQASAGEIADQSLADNAYCNGLQIATNSYNALIALGVAREQARMILPLSLYTEMYFTCNLVSLFHFLKLRLHKDAQREIMLYAKALLTLAEPHFPYSFEAFRETQKDNPLIYQGDQHAAASIPSSKEEIGAPIPSGSNAEAHP